MKQKLLLTLLALFTLGGSNLYAQEAGTYFLYNEESGLFISRGASWGTRSTADIYGIAFELTKINDGVYTLKNVDHSLAANANKYLGDNLYTDNGNACNYTFTAQGEGYLVSKGNGYLTANGSGEAITEVAEATNNSLWKLLSKEQYSSLLTQRKNAEAATIANAAGYDNISTLDDLKTLIGNTNSFISKDYTSKVGNADIGGGSGAWTKDHDGTRGLGDTKSGDGVFQSWNGCANIHQTINDLDEGIYKLTVQAFYRFGNAAAGVRVADNGCMVDHLYAGNNSTQLVSWYDIKTDDSTPNNMGAAHTLLDTDATIALVEVYAFVGEEKTLKIGINNLSYIDQDWMICDNFKLTYYTDKVTDAQITELVATIPTNIPTAVKNNLNTLKETLEITKSIAAFNELSAAIDAAAPVAEKYSAYIAVKTRMQTIKDAEGFTDEGSNAATAFDQAVSTQDEEVEQATTADAVQVCIDAVRSAAGTFLGAVTITGTVDVTALIMNDTPTSNSDFWTTTGNVGFDPNNNVAEYWGQSGVSIKQTLFGLPKGYYTLTAVALARPDQIGILSANENTVNLVQHFEQPSGNTTVGGSWFNDGNGVNTLSFSLENTTNVEIGITADNTTGDHWTLWRNFKLSYFGLDPLAADITLYQEALTNAQSVADNDSYDVVTGEESTALDQALTTYGNVEADYDDIEGSKTALQEAAAALNNAAQAVQDAVPSYQAYNAEKEKAVIIGLTNEIPVATNAAAAAAAVNQMKVAESTFVNTNYPAEVTELVGDLATWTGSTGTGTSNDQHWSGKTKAYYEQGGSNWGASAWEISYTKKVTLPAGKYMAKVAARGSAALTYNNLTISATENVMPLAHKGDNGKGITTDGTTSFDEGEFANNNNGRGWEWGYLPFELTESSEVTFTLASKAEGSRLWVSYCDFALLNVLATNEDYNALEAAKPNDIVLGFDEGEYAPYNNIEAATALELANTINPEEQNAQVAVQLATTTLQENQWVANTEEVNAIFDGQFATTEANTQSGNIKLPGWTKVDGIRLLVKDEATDPGLAYTNGKAGVFSWGGTTLTYGEEEGYTLPMNKYSIYELTMKVSGWRDGDLPSWISVDLDGDLQTYEQSVAGRVNQAEGNPFTTLTFYLEPTEDNSILKIYANKHFVIADLSMKLAIAEDITINEATYVDGIAYEPVDKYANVTFNRTLVEGWNGLVLPFDMTVEDAKTKFNATLIKDFTGVTYDTDKGATLVFDDATEIKAGKPFMIKSAAGSEFKLDGVLLKSDALQTISQEAGEAKYTMTGTYQKVDLTNANFVLIQGDKYYQHNTNKASSAKAFRAYFLNESTGEALSKGINIDFNGEATGIKLVEDGQNYVNGSTYNLQGQKVNHAQKGVYIVNGKKIVIK